MANSTRSDAGNQDAYGNRGSGTPFPSRKQGKTDRTRRCWSEAEEVSLLLNLKELVSTGWKSDNGFKAGYQVKLEEALRRDFPGTDLKANPHILSKIHTWKKCYGALSLVLSRSGVGFNVNSDYKVDCNEEQWQQIIKADQGARFLRNKAWPLYDDWKIVFGKDRATGESAKDTDAAVNELENDASPVDSGFGGEYHVNLEDMFGQTNEDVEVLPPPNDDSSFSTSRDARSTSLPNKKRKANDNLEALVDVIANMHEATNERLQHLANRIGYEFDLTKARKEVFELVGGIPGVTLA